jgi:predicted nucleic acid-binding protein
MHALDQADSSFVVSAVDRDIAAAVRRVPRSEIPDLPDRIIAAAALHLGLPLVSRDHKIRTSSIRTIW